MSSVNVKKQTTEGTVILFDSFYQTEVKVNQAEYDIVHSFFYSVYDDDAIANDFTSVIFQIAQSYNKPATEILEEMKGQDGVEVNATVAYYLNGLRSKATLLGVSNIQQPNIYAARNVQV